MRIIITTIALFISNSILAQKFTLIDRGWERPINYSDIVTEENLKDGWYPIYTHELDSLILIVEKFKTIFQSGMKRTNFNMLDFETSHIEVEISNVQRAYGDRYDINIISKSEFAKVSMKLSNSSISNRENQQLIKKFYNYLVKYRKPI